jgi:hypothetical protein
MTDDRAGVGIGLDVQQAVVPKLTEMRSRPTRAE